MLARLKWRSIATALLAAASVAAFATPTQAQAPSGQPIAIGFGMALSGPLAGFGRQALLGMKIWEEETNARGGLLGRPVKLVYYDDQSNPSTVPGIYTHHRRRSNPNQYGVNVACLKGVSPFDFANVPVIDGVNHLGDHGRGYEIVGHLRFIRTEDRSVAGAARPNSYG